MNTDYSNIESSDGQDKMQKAVSALPLVSLSIIVLQKGKLIQHGSHADLMQDQEGSYYAMWQSQAQWYQ